MRDDAMTPSDPGFADIARRLEAFSDLRLTPSAAAAARMRAEVMSVVDRRAGNASLGGAATPAAHGFIGFALSRLAASTSGRAPTARFGWHRPFAVVLAAALALGAMTGTTYAARPGGPLYETMVWVETLTLPSDSVARATAEVVRIEARLTDARSAMAAGDAVGAMAALDAYADIVATATAASDGDPAAAEVVEAGVGRQVAVLTGLASVVPVQAQAAIEHALASSTQALDQLGAGSPAGSNGNGPGGGSGNGQANSGIGGTAPDDRGGGADKPARPAKPSSEPASGPKGPKGEANDKGKGSKASSRPPRAEPTPKAAPIPKAPSPSGTP